MFAVTFRGEREIKSLRGLEDSWIMCMSWPLGQGNGSRQEMTVSFIRKL